MFRKREGKLSSVIQAVGSVLAALIGAAGGVFGTWMTFRLDGVRAELATAEARVVTQGKELADLHEKLGVCEDGLAELTGRFNPLAPPPTGWVRYGEKHRGRMENRLFKDQGADDAVRSCKEHTDRVAGR